MWRSLLLVLFALPHAGMAQLQAPATVPGELIVMLRPGALPDVLVEDLRAWNGANTGLAIARTLSAPMRTWLYRFNGSAIASSEMLRAVLSHPAVQLAQHNHVVVERAVPDDAQYASQWHHTLIGSEAAWDITTGGVTATGDTIVVCIVERADLPHPDLIANAWYNHDEIPGNGIDDDANGYIDDHRGWNPINDDDAVYGNAHGTQVAGMAGARGNNAQGVAGASWHVKLMPVHYGSTNEANVVEAYTYPLVMRKLYNETNGDRGAFIVATNASWGVNNGQPTNAPIWCAMYDSLGAAGVLNCGSTANSNVDVDVVGDLPTACPSDFLVSVTSTTQADAKAPSAAFGATTIDLGAPGAGVYTTLLGGGYGTASGTSFASPLVAGVIGLLYSAPCAALMGLAQSDPAAAAAYVKQQLLAGVDPLPDLEGITVTGGRVNAGNSMQLIMNGCGTCPAPFSLQATNTGLTSTVLTWASVAGSTYDVRYREVGAMDWVELIGLTTSTATLDGSNTCTPYEFQVRVHCEDETSEYSASHAWTSEGCCTAPSGMAISAVGPDEATLTWSTVLAADAYDLRWRISGTTDWVEETDVTAPFTWSGLANCTDYETQVRSSCAGNPSAWSSTLAFGTSSCGDCIDLDYCASESANSLTEWIARVAVGGIDNPTENDGGYGDYTALSSTLSVGVPHPITLEPGYAFASFAEYFRVWIDLDRNGIFSSPDELVFDPGSTTTGTVTGNLTVPATAATGPARMRVVMKYQNPTTDGCVTGYNYGETEDYCLELVGGVGSDDGSNGLVHRVFPSPASEQVHIQLDHAPTRTAMVMVMDHSGRMVAQQGLVNGRTTLDVSGLAEGLYLYRIMEGSRAWAHGRFAVVHRP